MKVQLNAASHICALGSGHRRTQDQQPPKPRSGQPPLVITEEELRDGFERVDRSLDAFDKALGL